MRLHFLHHTTTQLCNCCTVKFSLFDGAVLLSTSKLLRSEDWAMSRIVVFVGFEKKGSNKVGFPIVGKGQGVVSKVG